MKKLNKGKVVVKVNGKNALAKGEDVLVEACSDGSFKLKTRLGEKTKQDFEIEFYPYFEEEVKNDV